jgi:hypothetical protein
MPIKTAALATIALTLPASAEYFSIGPVPGNAPQGFSQVFSKHVEVLGGVHVYASSNTQNSKILHTANVLAQYLDNDEDGEPDDPAVFAKMQSLHASMMMWPNENAFENSGAEDIIPDSVWDSIAAQLQFGQETNPGYPENGQFDWTLEEVLHLTFTGGFAQVYPSVFAEAHNSDLADAMDIVIAGGWYHYNDPTCDYGCKVAEFHYWALTSMLGAQDYPWRIPEIADEWELPTAALMQQHAPETVAILADPQYHQATILPDGSYDPQSNDCPGDYDGSGAVDANDILAIIAVWGTYNAAIDLDGDGFVGVSDLLMLLEAWGDC